MKTLLILAASLCLSTGLSAQDGRMHDQTMQPSKTRKDHVAMRDGKMMVMLNGTMSTMDKDMTLPDGSMITTTGTYKRADGTTVQLRNGDLVEMDGRLVQLRGARPAK